MATETQAIRENYELGVLAGESRREAEIIKLLENHWAKNSFQNAHEVNGFYLAIALIKGEK